MTDKLFATWTFDRSGARLYGLRRGPDRRWAVWSIDVATGLERMLTTLEVSPRLELDSLSVHPDGQRFLATVVTHTSDIWLIDGLAEPR